MPKASVIVPAYNVAKTISDTLDALLAQTYDDFEIVIVDDGSTDDTQKIAQSYAARDSRVRIVRQTNRGLAGARNTGIVSSFGTYIGFCDSDDLWVPGKLAAHVAHLEAKPDVGLSYSGSALITEDGRPTGLSQSPKLHNITPEHIFKRNPVGNGSAPVFRRAALAAIAFRPEHEKQRPWVFDETFRQSEDIECWMRLALTTQWGIEGIPGLLTQYRINNSGLSAATDKQLDSWERMVAKLRPLNPMFFARVEPSARAYQLRYLARRAVSDRNGAVARKMVFASLRSSLRPIFEEPVKSFVTLAAALIIPVFNTAPLRKVTSILRARRQSA